jgi:hypothetical protein
LQLIYNLYFSSSVINLLPFASIYILIPYHITKSKTGKTIRHVLTQEERKRDRGLYAVWCDKGQRGTTFQMRSSDKVSNYGQIYRSKLSPETETVYVVSDGHIININATKYCQQCNNKYLDGNKETRRHTRIFITTSFYKFRAKPELYTCTC